VYSILRILLRIYHTPITSVRNLNEKINHFSTVNIYIYIYGKRVAGLKSEKKIRIGLTKKWLRR